MAKLVTEDEILKIREGLAAADRAKDALNYSSMVQTQEAVLDNTNVVRNEAGLSPLVVPQNKFREDNKDVNIENLPKAPIETAIIEGMKETEQSLFDEALEPEEVEPGIFEKGGKIVDNVVNKAKDNILKFGADLPSVPDKILKNPLLRINPRTNIPMQTYNGLEKLQEIYKNKKIFKTLSLEQQKRITDAIVDVSEWAGIKIPEGEGQQFREPESVIEDSIIEGMQESEQGLFDKPKITPREVRKPKDSFLPPSKPTGLEEGIEEMIQNQDPRFWDTKYSDTQYKAFLNKRNKDMKKDTKHTLLPKGIDAKKDYGSIKGYDMIVGAHPQSEKKWAVHPEIIELIKQGYHFDEIQLISAVDRRDGKEGKFEIIPGTKNPQYRSFYK